MNFPINWFGTKSYSSANIKHWTVVPIAHAHVWTIDLFQFYWFFTRLFNGKLRFFKLNFPQFPRILGNYLFKKYNKNMKNWKVRAFERKIQKLKTWNENWKIQKIIKYSKIENDLIKEN